MSASCLSRHTFARAHPRVLIEIKQKRFVGSFLCPERVTFLYRYDWISSWQDAKEGRGDTVIDAVSQYSCLSELPKLTMKGVFHTKTSHNRPSSIIVRLYSFRFFMEISSAVKRIIVTKITFDILEINKNYVL